MPTIALDYSPHAYQQDLHTAVQRYKCIAGGRRVGKSKMALMELVRHALSNPKSVCWWVAPTIGDARDVGWKELKELTTALQPLIKNMNETRLECTFRNLSTITFKGAEAETSLRGRGLSYLVLDEAAFIQEDVWNKILRPALADKSGKALLISTPNGKNWFYDRYIYALMDKNSNWLALHWPTPLNPLITQEELIDASMNMSELDFRQEFMAEFITKSGMVYDDFNNDNIVEPGTPNIHAFDVYLGMDFGYANPSAICFMAVDRETGNVFQFDEIYIARTPIDELERMVMAKLGKNGLAPYDVRAIYTDPAGNAEELTSGTSPVDFLRGSPHKWTVENMGSEIAPGIALVRSYIRNHVGLRRFFITANCGATIDSLSRYSYAETTKNNSTIKEEPFKDGKYDHMADAIRYFFVNKFDKARYVSYAPPEQTPYHITPEYMGLGKLHLHKCVACGKKFPSKLAAKQIAKCTECIDKEVAYV